MGVGLGLGLGPGLGLGLGVVVKVRVVDRGGVRIRVRDRSKLVVGNFPYIGPPGSQSWSPGGARSIKGVAPPRHWRVRFVESDP